ncbi:MAG: glycosyltransferase family 4 protein [Candidatus Lokiarchaeota archaeon]|nr:glycosyltransferase family 4 protein [Candidatus Lokiarchaeota archaeon]
MHVAILSPIAWRTPPRSYGPWEYVASLLTEGLVEKGIEATLFATKNSITKANLLSVCAYGYEEDSELIPKVWECLHISELFERGDDFDIIHNHFDFLPLTYMKMTSTPVVTTIHGISSPKILPVYQKYNNQSYYVSISNAARIPSLNYIATVYHGIDLNQFSFRIKPKDYLLFFGRIHHDKGAKEAIQIARKAGMKLILAGIIQDKQYFKENVEPFLDKKSIEFVGVANPKKRDELLGGAYALLNPINVPEAFGLSVVESMACGTPVITFNKGSMQEVIVDGKTGFLVDSIDEAVKSLKKVKEINRSECRQWVEKKFTVERMVNDYIKVYELILTKEKH